MQVKVKKLFQNAVIPKYAKEGDAGLDLTAISKDGDGVDIWYGTGLAVEIPEGYVGLIFPRSSIYKEMLNLSNSVGVIDSGFRGEIQLRFNRAISSAEGYEVGDRIGQLVIMPYPKVELVKVNKLSDSDRGAGGFGSTGA